MSAPMSNIKFCQTDKTINEENNPNKNLKNFVSVFFMMYDLKVYKAKIERWDLNFDYLT